jgi:hypothetical protein
LHYCVEDDGEEYDRNEGRLDDTREIVHERIAGPKSCSGEHIVVGLVFCSVTDERVKDSGISPDDECNVEVQQAKEGGKTGWN